MKPAGKIIVAILIAISAALPAHARWFDGIFGSFASGGKNVGVPLPREMLVEEATRAEDLFVAPNEFDAYLHHNRRRADPPVKNGPLAIVAVGTFRAFGLLGALERDYLIAVDYAPGATEFNLALARLMTRHKRIKLLGLLIGREDFAVPKDADERAFIRSVAEQLRAGKLSLTEATTPIVRDADLRIVMSHFRHLSGSRSNWDHWLNAIVGFTESPERYAAFILGNEKGYQHAAKTIAEGRFAAVTGSISGPETMRSVGAALEHVGASVSEVDVSNALEGVAQNEGNKGLRRFEIGFLSLPLANGAKMLLTIDSRLKENQRATLGPGRDHWRYEMLGPREIGAIARSPRNLHELLKSYDLVFKSVSGGKSPRCFGAMGGQ